MSSVWENWPERRYEVKQERAELISEGLAVEEVREEERVETRWGVDEASFAM